MSFLWVLQVWKRRKNTVPFFLSHLFSFNSPSETSSFGLLVFLTHCILFLLLFLFYFRLFYILFSLFFLSFPSLPLPASFYCFLPLLISASFFSSFSSFIHVSLCPACLLFVLHSYLWAQILKGLKLTYNRNGVCVGWACSVIVKGKQILLPL